MKEIYKKQAKYMLTSKLFAAQHFDQKSNVMI